MKLSSAAAPLALAFALTASAGAGAGGAGVKTARNDTATDAITVQLVNQALLLNTIFNTDNMAAAQPVQAPTASDRRADLVEALMPSVVAIHGIDQKGGQVDVGSGFVYKANEGYIITNAHVVDDKAIASVKVTLSDDRNVDAKIVGFDKTFDIAVLQLLNPGEAGLAQTAFDTANTLRVANDVIAIGAPFGFERSVTKGIVSAFHRKMDQGPCDDYIQIDAAVNPGNSGGPLFNEKGEVVGVNSMIYSSTHQFAGMAFSIPINQAIKVADLLIAKGKIHWGFMGIGMLEVDAKNAEKLKLGAPNGGILVTGVTAGQPAQKAGLAVNDVLTALNGEPVSDVFKLSCKVAELQSGAQAALTFLRKGQEMHTVVTLGEKPSVETEKAKIPPKPHKKPKVPHPEPRPYHVEP